MPGFSRVVEVDGGRYLDGGASDSIPLRAFEDMGYQRNLVVLTQVEGYRKKPAGLVEKLAYALSLHKIPAMKKSCLIVRICITQSLITWPRNSGLARLMCFDPALTWAFPVWSAIRRNCRQCMTWVARMRWTTWTRYALFWADN